VLGFHGSRGCHTAIRAQQVRDLCVGWHTGFRPDMVSLSRCNDDDDDDDDDDESKAYSNISNVCNSNCNPL
jgi:hypothetical protein